MSADKKQIVKDIQFCKELMDRLIKDVKNYETYGLYNNKHTVLQGDIIRLRRELNDVRKKLDCDYQVRKWEMNMADIELVIKLDEKYIKQIDRIKFLIGAKEDRSLQVNVIKAIKNGTLIPKGHGDLIDKQELLKSALCKTFGLRSVDIDNAPTIIEADRYRKECEKKWT